MEFCPECGTLARYHLASMDQPARFVCVTCPYVGYLENRVAIRRKERLVKKPPEPVFTLEDCNKGGAETEATCPQCNHGRARFQQMQIRSADEPATTFYTCLNEDCGKTWKED